MQPSSKWVLGLVVALTLALAVSLALRQPAVPDQDQIAAQLETARAAAEAHDVGGIIRVISADFKGPDPISNVDSLHFYLGQALRRSGRVQVSFSPPNVVVQGDTATSASQLTVRDGASNEVLFSQPVTLDWRREAGHRLLVLPARVWRVVGAQYQGSLPGEDG